MAAKRHHPLLLWVALVITLVIWAYAYLPDLIEQQRFYRFDPIIWKKSATAERYYMAKYLVDHHLLIGQMKAAVVELLGKPDQDAGFILYDLGPERSSLFRVDHDWLVIDFDGYDPPALVSRTRIRPD